MTRRWPTLLVAVFVVVYVVLAATGMILERVVLNAGGDPQRLDLSTLLAFSAFLTVGAVVVIRRPGNPLGWIYCAVAVSGGMAAGLVNYAHFGIEVRSVPLLTPAAWVSSWIWMPTIGLVFTFALLLFPTGRPPTRRWRWVAWLSAVGLVVLASPWAFGPGPLEGLEGVSNPLGVPGIEPLLEPLQLLGVLMLGLSAVLCALSLFVRFRRSKGDERAQLKWFAYAAGLNAVVIVVTTLVPGAEDTIPEWLFGPMIALIPIAAGGAILRYRLYDIDLVINRTLVYGFLTAVLVGVYLASVAALQTVLPLDSDDQFSVAASTLLVAAAFNPLRRRVQTGIDHLFYRQKYDAERTIEEFRARLRDEVELSVLTTELVRVVDDTVQPLQASLWIRPDIEASR